MQPALARHDALARTAVEGNRGMVVKMIGDGMHAAFEDPLDAVRATLQLQQALSDPAATNGITLRVRCGLHVGVVERRDNDFFGSVVNRAARIMGAAHGGQMLLSEAVLALLRDRLPESVSHRDLGVVRLRDLASPMHVYQLVHPQLRQDFPALRSLEVTPNNLPQQVSSFIGRERELAEARELLGKTRLLTLVGVGGLGKTRLSLQLAADRMDDYPDGVWFVELAPLADERLVPQAVASVLGVKEEAGRPVIEALVKHVEDRQLLLVLDNCEHLVRACAELAKSLLQAGPQMKVLATSREHLHVVGETSYSVPALAFTDPHHSNSLAALTRSDAVRLFIDRAVAAQSAFELTRQNAAAVATICHRLDGIPLAIELAAARVRALSAEKIAVRLSDRFRLLTGGDQTAVPRQQTLRASIDWSYELLVEPERALLRRLAVFAGGFALEAAEAVGVHGEIDEAAVLDLVTHLVEKSLVAAEAAGERYRLLETIREYAFLRLNESGDADDTRSRHLAYYVALAKRGFSELMGREQGTWLARLDLERENLLSAHAWCDHAKGGAELGLRLAVYLKRYWQSRGLIGLGYRLAVEALIRVGAQERSLLRCRTLAAAGEYAFNDGRLAQAQGHLEESLAMARALGEKQRVAEANRLLGFVSLEQGAPIKALGHMEEALALARELGDKGALANALNGLAELHRTAGEREVAEPLYEQFLTLAREFGDRGSIATGLLNLAMLLIGRESGDRARGMLLEVLAIVEEIGSKMIRQGLLDVAAARAASIGEWARAARFYGAAEAQLEQMEAHRERADEASLAPLFAKAREALGAAAFATAETAGRALSYEEALAEVRAWLEDHS